MLAALAIQWLTVQVSASSSSAPAVIIAGAEEITRPHLERLSDACERRRVPLTVLYRHLREDSLHLLGGGTAAFMRLGHHAEAEQAASYIGCQHKFVLSQRTATTGGNQTLTRTGTGTGTEGYSDSDTSSKLAGVPLRPRQQIPRNIHLPELVHLPVLGRRHQLERRHLHPARLRIRRRASRPAEPPRPRPPARRPRPVRPAAASSRMRPRHRHPARRQRPAPGTSRRGRLRRCCPAGTRLASTTRSALQSRLPAPAAARQPLRRPPAAIAPNESPKATERRPLTSVRKVRPPFPPGPTN